ncbi:MAG: hypothetical protein ACM3ML_27465 [Micromonosporaceae bacterium]
MITEVHLQVAGLLGHPRASGWGGDARQVHAPGTVFDEEHHVQAAQKHHVHMEEVRRQHRVGLGGLKCAPSLATPVRRGSAPTLLRIFQTVDGAS